MKVLHVYRTYFPDPPGGGQEAIRQICLSTQSFGVENTIFTLSPNPSPTVVEYPEAHVVRCRSWAAPASCDLGDFTAFSTFRRLAKQSDVVHYHFPWPFADLLQTLVRPEVPAVMTYLSDVVRQRTISKIYAPLMYQMFNSMARIIITSPGYAHISPALSDSDVRQKVRLIPLGIQEETYPVQNDERVFQRLGITKNEPFVLFLGVLRYYKGLHTLLEACRGVNGKVLIAGSGAEERALHGQATRLNLKNVIFAGRVSDAEKVTLLQNCRALVLPSHLKSESFGMVLVEASLFGKPMVTCEIGTGTSFINQHDETGYVVPPESPEELAQALNKLFADSQLAEKFGKAARQRYEKYFSGVALGRSYADLYHKVCQPIQAHEASQAPS